MSVSPSWCCFTAAVLCCAVLQGAHSLASAVFAAGSWIAADRQSIRWRQPSKHPADSCMLIAWCGVSCQGPSVLWCAGPYWVGAVCLESAGQATHSTHGVDCHTHAHEHGHQHMHMSMCVHRRRLLPTHTASDAVAGSRSRHCVGDCVCLRLVSACVSPGVCAPVPRTCGCCVGCW